MKLFEDEKKATEAEEPKPEEAPQPKKRRGFALLDREKIREIAAKGGVAAHARGTAHRFTTDEARVNGRKGGAAPHRTRGGRRRTAPTGNGAGAPPIH